VTIVWYLRASIKRSCLTHLFDIIDLSVAVVVIVYS
jgi:hypothetical protein